MTTFDEYLQDEAHWGNTVGYWSTADLTEEQFFGMTPAKMALKLKAQEFRQTQAEKIDELKALYGGIFGADLVKENPNPPYPGGVHLRPETKPLTAQLFEDGLEHLRKHGWTQGTDVEMTTGRVCSLGAVGLWRLVNVEGTVGSEHDRDRHNSFYYRQAEAMELMGITGFDSVIAWNDYPGRTEDQVIEAFERAAKKLRDLGR